MDYIDILNEGGPEILALILFFTFTIWIFKSFYERQYERNTYEENLNLEGLKALSEALFSCQAYKKEYEVLNENRLLLYKAIPFISASRSEEYLCALDTQDILTLESIILKSMKHVQSERFDKLSDGKSFISDNLNMIYRTPFSVFCKSLYMLIFFYILIGGVSTLCTRIPSGAIVFPLIATILSALIFYLLCKCIDKSIKNSTNHKLWILVPVSFFSLIIVEIVIIYKCFYIWKSWLFVLSIFTIGIIGFVFNWLLNSKILKANSVSQNSVKPETKN